MDAFAPPAETEATVSGPRQAPRDAIAVLLEAAQLYARNLSLVVTVALAANAPLVALQLSVGPVGVSTPVFSLVQLVVDALVAASVLVAIERRERGEEVSVPGAFAGGYGRWGPLLAAWVTTNILTGIATIFLILPGVWVAVHYGLVAPVVVFERRSYSRSWELVASRRKMAAAVLVPLALGTFLAPLVVNVAVDAALLAINFAPLPEPLFALFYAPAWALLTCGEYVLWRSLTEPLVDAR